MSFRRRNILFLLLLLLGAVACRWFYISRFLEYDEIWTLENFARLSAAEIFAELSVPNNHPVNTLLVKFFALPGKNWSVRLASLIFSCGTVIFGALCARRIYSRSAAFYTFAALALLPPFISAGATARGYAGQLFFLTLFAYCLLRCRKGDMLFTAGAAISAVLSVVSLPSSMLYLIPGGGYFLWTMAAKKRLRKHHLYIFGAAVMFAVLWFFRHWFNFQETAKFAIPLTSFSDVYRWLCAAAGGNGVFVPLLVAAVILKRQRKITYLLAALVIFPVAAAYFTGAAPARVYLPSAAAAVMVMAPLKVRFRKIWFVIALAVQLIYSAAALPDLSLQESFAPPSREHDADIMLYSATDGYVVRYNRPQAVEKFLQSLIRAEKKPVFSLRVINSAELSGVDKSGNSRQWQLPPFQDGYARYHLCRTAVLAPGETGFLLLPPMPVAAMELLQQDLPPLEMLELNAWLTVPLTGNGTSPVRYMMLAVKSPVKCEFPGIMPLYVIRQIEK